MGEYNLLPHQKALLRALVKDYQESGQSSNNLVVTGTGGGVGVIWADNRNFEYDGPASESDFAQLANEGLLGQTYTPRGSPIYLITQRSIEAVQSDFVCPEPTPAVVVAGNQSAIAIGANAIAIANQVQIEVADPELQKAVSELKELLEKSPSDRPSILDKLMSILEFLKRVPEAIVILRPLIDAALAIISIPK